MHKYRVSSQDYPQLDVKIKAPSIDDAVNQLLISHPIGKTYEENKQYLVRFFSANDIGLRKVINGKAFTMGLAGSSDEAVFKKKQCNLDCEYENVYPGIKRGTYASLCAVLLLIGPLLILKNLPQISPEQSFYAYFKCFMLLLIPTSTQLWFYKLGLSMIPVSIIAYYRIKNIGWSRFLVLLNLVPIVSTILQIVCLALPENFSKTKKIDTAAIVVTVLGAIYLVYIIALITSSYTSFI